MYRHKPVNRHVSLPWDGKDDEPLRFVQLADTQFGIQRRFDNSREGWENELSCALDAAESINQLEPAFAIVCGDLIDEMPHEDLDRRKKQLQDFNTFLDSIKPSIPLLCLCGNHDIGDRPNGMSIAQYKEDFGDDYFTFTLGTRLRGLVLNSQLYKDSTDCADLKAAQHDWLMEKMEDGPWIIFSHIPPFIEAWDEKDAYFNLDTDCRKPLLEAFYSGGSRHWFAGHFHRNAGGTYKDLEVIVTGSVGCMLGTNTDGDPHEISGISGPMPSEECGVRVVDVKPDNSLTHRWYTLKEFRELSQQKL